MLVPPHVPLQTLAPLAIDPAGWLAPLGIAVLSFTLLRRYRVRMKASAAATRGTNKDEDRSPIRDAIRESAGTWELRLHDAGRAAEASLNTRAAELGALAERAEDAALRLRTLPESCEDATVLPLPSGEERVRLHLRQAGYDEGQIDVILARDGEGERRRAA